MKKIAAIFAFTLLMASSAIAQRTITGTVTDRNGDVLIGATVTVKDSNPAIVTTTTTDGVFSLKVPEGYASLLVSSTGYRTEEVSLSNEDVYNIRLEETSARIVVVDFSIPAAATVQRSGSQPFTREP